MFGLRRKGLPVSVMLELEDSLDGSELRKHGTGKDDEYAAYLTVAGKMRYDDMVSEIARYDESSPRMNPVSFVNHLCATYKVDKTTAIRRVQEVRAIKARRELS